MAPDKTVINLSHEILQGIIIGPPWFAKAWPGGAGLPCPLTSHQTQLPLKAFEGDFFTFPSSLLSRMDQLFQRPFMVLFHLFGLSRWSKFCCLGFFCQLFKSYCHYESILVIYLFFFTRFLALDPKKIICQELTP